MIFPTKIKNNIPNSKYKPINPKRVNKVFPEDTVGDAPADVRNKL